MRERERQRERETKREEREREREKGASRVVGALYLPLLSFDRRNLRQCNGRATSHHRLVACEELNNNNKSYKHINITGNHKQTSERTSERMVWCVYACVGGCI